MLHLERDSLIFHLSAFQMCGLCIYFNQYLRNKNAIYGLDAGSYTTVRENETRFTAIINIFRHACFKFKRHRKKESHRQKRTSYCVIILIELTMKEIH